MWLTSRRSRAAALALASLALAGCGGHKSASTFNSQGVSCADLAQHERFDQIVRSMIARGAIEKQEVGKHFSGIPKNEYLDAAGALLPFERLSHDSQRALLLWVGQLESQPGGAKIAAAGHAAAARAKAPCNG